MNPLPPHLHADYYGWDEPVDDRAEAVGAAAERIENDADLVRELVAEAIGSDDPCGDTEWARDLLITLRELKPVFSRLTCGDTLGDALRTPAELDHFRALLRCVNTADTWIAKVIVEAAEDNA